MKRFLQNAYLPLFWKFAIAITAIVLLFGSLNLLFIRNQVYNTFENQIEKQGLSIAIGIAEGSIDPILFNDVSALNKLLVRTKTINPDLEYIFLVSPNNEVIAHTFETVTPSNLINANVLPDTVLKKTVLIHDTSKKNRIIRDMAIPIFDKRLGIVRIGLKEDAFSEEISNTTRLFLQMVFVLLLLGILASLALSYIISSPLRAISEQASQVNFDSLSEQTHNFDSLETSRMNKWKNIFNFSDEIDILNSTFIQMLMRLKGAYSELKSAQDSLSQTEKMASVGTLAAGLAHEINNPIAGIRNCLRRISDKPENIKQNAEYFEMMNEAIDKIENVVQGMLSFSRKQELTFSRIDIIKSIENAIGLTGYQLEMAQITLKREYEDQSIFALASPNHLEQVFVNILLNSIDAISERKQVRTEPNGEIAVLVKKNDGTIKIEFSDNGTGMPEDKVASLFDPFFTLKKIRQGTGLGMAVSYNIISSHLGQIAGKNNEEGGFCITITLPQPLD